MKQSYIIAFISIYLIASSFTHEPRVEASFLNQFQNDDSWIFKQLDSFRKTMDQFKKSFDNKLRMFSRFKNETSLNVIDRISNKTSHENKRFEQNSCKCVNFTCECCANIDIKQFNFSNRGFKDFFNALLVIPN
jgi:hypothetical protein